MMMELIQTFFTLKKDLGTPLSLHCSEIRETLKIAIEVVPVIFAFLTCIDHMEFFTEEGGKLFTCSYLLTTKLKAPQLLDLENKEAILH